MTADIWSNASLRAFLAVTAHWIGLKDSKLDLKAALIGFHLLKKKHTGKNIAKTILHLTDRAGITEKASVVGRRAAYVLTMLQIGHITLDNAENNATAMKQLEILLNDRGIEFDAKDNRIPCYPHIVNICVSHIVSSFTKVNAADTRGADYSDDNDDDDDDDDAVPTADGEDEDEEDNITAGLPVDLEEWFEALKRDPVKRARVVVRTVRSSGERKSDFQKLIQLGNNMKSFKDENNKVIILRELQLLKDVRHRWDSLYLMLARLDELHPVRLLYIPWLP